jgi:hypothetical protein
VYKWLLLIGYAPQDFQLPSQAVSFEILRWFISKARRSQNIYISPISYLPEGNFDLKPSMARQQALH